MVFYYGTVVAELKRKSGSLCNTVAYIIISEKGLENCPEKWWIFRVSRCIIENNLFE
jgi:hypothetical protein